VSTEACAQTATLRPGRALRRDWLGRLTLRYGQRDARTVVVQRRHQGPLLVQRSFHPEGKPCHSYLIHPPGGVAGGDRLLLDVDLDPDTHALLTTPSAAKFYRSGGDQAQQTQTFRLGIGACCEFLPAETILHGGSDARIDTRFELATDSRLCCWDMLCLGRPGSGDDYRGGRLLQTLTLLRDGQPLFRDRLCVGHGDVMLDAPWGLAGRSVIGLLLATPVQDAGGGAQGLSAALREALGDWPALRWGLTCMNDVLLLRCLGQGAEPVKALLQRAWTQLRPLLFDRPACPPRIWRT